MRPSIVMSAAVLIVSQVSVSPVLAQKCPPDSVPVGPICVDRYEVSVWALPASNKVLLKRVQEGTADLNDLLAGGAIQRGVGVSDDYACSDNGNNCNQIFAVSIGGVFPSASITWFQAQQACANSGKRLPTNAEWQMAAAGTVDPGENDGLANTKCNTMGRSARSTGNAGSAAGGEDSCVSRWGVQDMVGNLWEWVADWTQDNSDNDGGDIASGMFGNDGIFGIDEAAIESDRFPAALWRGGSFGYGTNAGVFALWAHHGPTESVFNLGFRCAR